MATLPPLPDLLNTINVALGNIPSSLSSASEGSDVFEAYVFSLVLQAAVAEGATVTFRNRDGSTPGSAIFRTSPGHLYSTAQNYTYARIAFPNVPLLEAHTGVFISGKSRLFHEADVVVLTSAEADLSRNNSVPPRSHACVLTAECKFFSSNITLGLGRGFVGLCSDLSADESFFITNSGSISIEKLLTHKGLNWTSQLRPSQVGIVTRPRNEIQVVFKNYKVAYA